MKVEYKTVLPSQWGNDTYAAHVELNYTPCCDSMRFARKGGFIVFYDWGLSSTPTLAVTCHQDDGDGGWSLGHLGIKNCPFCGEKVECVETQKVRRVPRVKEHVERIITYTEEPVQ